MVMLSDKAHQFASFLRAQPVFYWQNALIVLAVLWLCHSLATLFWVVVGEPELEQPAKIAVAPKAAAQVTSSNINLASLQELELFGSLSAAPLPAATPEPAADDEVLDVTKLNLKLQGVIASSDSNQGGAIIEEGSEQAFYSVGDELNKNRGVKLVKVLNQRVIINNKGKRESLWLYSEEDFKKTAQRNARPVGLNRKTNSRSFRGTQRSVDDEDENVPPENLIRAKARPDQLPKSVGDVVRFSVHREGGKMVGYRIRPGKDRELFEQLGLQTNDIVISVNGIDVDDPKKIRSVYKEVKSAPEALLTVLRDGQTFSINISLDTETGG